MGITALHYDLTWIFTLNYSARLNQKLLEAATGYAAAGDLVDGKGSMILVGEVMEAVDLCGLLKPVDEGRHFRAGCFLDASDADVDDDEGHVRDS